VIHSSSEKPSVADLKPGSLVSIAFAPQQGRTGAASEISVLAQPGSVYTFLGKITYIDLSRKFVAIANQTDSKTYDINVEAVPLSILRQLYEGIEVGVTAVFDGMHYSDRSLEVGHSDQASVD
jgi:hypothetical protein